MEVGKEQIYNITLGVGLWFCRSDVGLQLGCIGLWSYNDEIVLEFKSVEELYPYPSPLLGVDSAACPVSKEKNLRGQFQYFQVTQPGSNYSLYQ
jgi:hypothetical protein